MTIKIHSFHNKYVIFGTFALFQCDNTFVIYFVHGFNNHLPYFFIVANVYMVVTSTTSLSNT